FTIIEDDIATVKEAPHSGFYWIDATVDELSLLQPIFDLHELAIEDSMHDEEQRPKLEIYEDNYFMVINSIRFDDEEIFLRALKKFLGHHRLITATMPKISELPLVKRMFPIEDVRSPERLLFHLVDTVVDNCSSVTDRSEET